MCLIGNNFPIKTYRPITKFNRLIFGEFGNKSIESNYNIRSKPPVNVQVTLNDNIDELTIECDQNLQKFFILESNGDYLKLKLDSFDDNSKKTIYYSSFFSDDETLKQNKLDQNQNNFIDQLEPIKINLRTKNSYLYINKSNFGILNIKVGPGQSGNDFQVMFDCNDQIVYNNISQQNNGNINKFGLKSNYKNQLLSIGLCSEIFEIYFKKSEEFFELISTKK